MSTPRGRHSSASASGRTMRKVTPIACCHSDASPLSLDDYLTLVDATGRLIRGDNRGHIQRERELAPILARLDIDLEAWLRCIQGWRQFLGSAVGGLAARAAEAGRRGLRWVQNRCGLFAGLVAG